MLNHESETALRSLTRQFQDMHSNAKTREHELERLLTIHPYTGGLEVTTRILTRPLNLLQLARIKKDLVLIQRYQTEFEQVMICITHNPPIHHKLLPGAVDAIRLAIRLHENTFKKYRSDKYDFKSLQGYFEDCYALSYSGANQ